MTAEYANNNPAITAFRALHKSGCFILPNLWDIGLLVAGVAGTVLIILRDKNPRKQKPGISDNENYSR
jgi:hypothetical protein